VVDLPLIVFQDQMAVDYFLVLLGHIPDLISKRREDRDRRGEMAGGRSCLTITPFTKTYFFGCDILRKKVAKPTQRDGVLVVGEITRFQS
jgi:hypothetical protein